MRSILRYYVLAIAITWTCWAPLYLGKLGLGWLPIDVPMPWIIVGTTGPMLAGLITHRIDSGDWRAFQAFSPWRRLVTGTIAGIALIVILFQLAVPLMLTQNPPNGWSPAALLLYFASPLATIAAGPLFEEWGWRGYAQARLQRRIGPLRAALVIGPAWAIWHLPLFLIPTWSSASPLSFLLIMTMLSIVIAWGFNLAGGAVVAAILMHATFNASPRALAGLLGEAKLRDWPDGVTAILFAFGGAALLLAIATRGRLGLRLAKPAVSDPAGPAGAGAARSA